MLHYNYVFLRVPSHVFGYTQLTFAYNNIICQTVSKVNIGEYFNTTTMVSLGDLEIHQSSLSLAWGENYFFSVILYIRCDGNVNWGTNFCHKHAIKIDCAGTLATTGHIMCLRTSCVKFWIEIINNIYRWHHLPKTLCLQCACRFLAKSMTVMLELIIICMEIKRPFIYKSRHLFVSNI